MRYVEDFDLYQRLRPFGRIAQIDAVLMLYRCHAGGASQMFNNTMRAHAELLLRERHVALLGEARPTLPGCWSAMSWRASRCPISTRSIGCSAGSACCGRHSGRQIRTRTSRRSIARSRSCGGGSAARACDRARCCSTVRWAVSRCRLGQAADLVACQMIGGMRAVKRGLSRR
jgi:hypothetical protein